MKSLRNEISHILRSKFIIKALIMPLIFATVFGYIFSNSQINQGRIAVIDEDNSRYSHELVNLLDAPQYIQVADVFHQAVEPDKLLYNEDYSAIIYLPRELEQNRLQGKQTNIGLLVDFTVPATSADLRAGINEVIATQNTTTSMGRLKAMGILKQVGGFRFVCNPFEFLLPLFLYTLVSGLVGMLLGWTAKSPQGAMARGFGLVITSFFLSGIQTPVALFPQAIQVISKLLPLTWNFKFIRGMGLRGGSIGYFKSEIGVFLIMIAVVLLLHIINILREGQKSHLQSL